MDEDINVRPGEPVEPAPAQAAPPSEAEGVDVPGPEDFEPPVMPEPEPLPAPPAAPDFETPPPPPPPTGAPYTAPPPPAQAPLSGEKNKLVAGILAILLGGLGIHKFYLGYTKEGIIMLLVSLLSFGALAWAMSIVGIIEGVLYLTKTDPDFEATYVVGRKPWF